MQIITSREFREHQKSYLDKVDQGLEILISRGKNRSYKIVPVTNDDTLMSREDFFAQIDNAIKEIKEGKYYSMKKEEDLDAFLTQIEVKENV